MDISNYPPGSDQYLSTAGPYPKVIIYKKATSPLSWDVIRRYEKCGCYVHSPSLVESIPAYCLIHGGNEPCFFTLRRQKRKLRRLLEEYDRDITDIKHKEAAVRRLLERDSSPERH
jgi:hypothetical protein